MNPHALRHRILSPKPDVFRDQLMSYNAGNIRVSGQPTSSEILWINPEVGTKWALSALIFRAPVHPEILTNGWINVHTN